MVHPPGASPADVLPPRTELVLQPTLEEASRAAEALHGLLPAALDEEARHLVELGVAEVLTNIVRHGRCPAGATIRLACWTDGGRLHVEVADPGLPIPAGLLEAAGPQAFAFDPDDIASLPEGGMGLALLRLAFDEVAYASDGGTNTLRLAKQLPPAGEP